MFHVLAQSFDHFKVRSDFIDHITECHLTLYLGYPRYKTRHVPVRILMEESMTMKYLCTSLLLPVAAQPFSYFEKVQVERSAVP